MEICRICGVECAPKDLLPVYEGGGCRSCNGSPACKRCGHPRRQHRGTFGSGEAGCKARVAADSGLAVGRCGCAGYTTDAAAFAEPVAMVDVNDLRLRRAGEPARIAPAARAPVRDLLDEGRRLGDRTGLDSVPWRPPSG